MRLSRVLLPTTAILTILTTGVVWQLGINHEPATDVERFTERELQAVAGGSGEIDFRSSDPVKLRDWIKTRTQMDVELPSGRSALIGVRLIQLAGAPVAAIAYRAGTETAMLVVSRRPAARKDGGENSRHLFARVKSMSGTRLVSWNKQDQIYTAGLVGSVLSGGECFLCHAHGAF